MLYVPYFEIFNNLHLNVTKDIFTLIVVFDLARQLIFILHKIELRSSVSTETLINHTIIYFLNFLFFIFHEDLTHFNI